MCLHCDGASSRYDFFKKSTKVKDRSLFVASWRGQGPMEIPPVNENVLQICKLSWVMEVFVTLSGLKGGFRQNFLL